MAQISVKIEQKSHGRSRDKKMCKNEKGTTRIKWVLSSDTLAAYTRASRNWSQTFSKGSTCDCYSRMPQTPTIPRFLKIVYKPIVGRNILSGTGWKGDHTIEILFVLLLCLHVNVSCQIILRLRSCLFCEGRISVLKRWFKTPIQNAVNSGYCSSSSEPERRLYDVI